MGPTIGEVHTAGLQLMVPLSAPAGSGVAAIARSAAPNNIAALTILFTLIADLPKPIGSLAYTICAKAARHAAVRDIAAFENGGRVASLCGRAARPTGSGNLPGPGSGTSQSA